MTDGKVFNALTDMRSTQKCYVCGASPKMMNGELKGMVDKKENYSFGLSTLHAWIRTFEWLLHISYRLGIKSGKQESMRINVVSDNARKKSNKSLKNNWDLL